MLVDASTHPYLRGHRIDDVPVLPVVLVLEWMLRAARLCRPELEQVVCKDLEVLRGLRLEHFDRRQPLTIVCRQLQNGSSSLLAAELHDSEGQLRYRASLELTPRGPTPALEPAQVLEGEPWPYAASDIYGPHLFHEEGFQVIRTLDAVSPEGGGALLDGTRAMGWPGGGWQTDPAALDGGLQLAILWGEQMLGKSSLPTRVGAFHRYRDGLLPSPLHCALRGRVVGGSRTVSDITFSTAEGDVVAELRGVGLHALPARDR